MTTETGRVPLPDSELRGFATKNTAGRPDDSEVIDVTVHLRAKDHPDASARLKELADSPPLARKHLSREECAELFGASAEDVAAAERLAADHQLEVVKVEPEQRDVTLRGTCAQLERAFGVVLHHFHHRGRVCRAYRGPISIPTRVQGAVVGVTGLSDHPVFLHRGAARVGKSRANPPSPPGPAGADRKKRAWTAADMWRACRFPAGATGTGQCIGILGMSGKDNNSPGGGILRSDLLQFGFTEEELQRQLKILGPNAPYDDKEAWQNLLQDPGFPANPSNDGFFYNHTGPQWTLEATADTELCLSLAPEATVILRFTETYGEKGVLAALNKLVHKDKPQPTVLTLSLDWVEDENHMSQQFRKSLDKLFKEANALGITVCAAAGDCGSLGTPIWHDSKPSTVAVQFPASSPEVLACGGVAMRTTGPEGNELEFESVWKERYLGVMVATGGGLELAAKENRPEWQKEAVGEWLEQSRFDADVQKAIGDPTKLGRGVPDVAGPADYAHGCRLVMAGCELNANGTSAAAPLWASLLASVYQRLAEAGTPRVGEICSLLYNPEVRRTFRDVKSGTNAIVPGGRVFKATPGSWDPCTGLGGPDGEALLAALEKLRASAQTPARP